MQYADGSVREEGIWVYKNSAWVKVGSDQTGDINYISNGDAEAGNTAGWSLGNVTLTNKFPSGVPTFGSGAAGTLSFTNSSSAALAGTRSFVLASSAATTAGNFLASDAFTIDAADLAKVLSIDITYKVDSGTINASGTSNNSFGIAIYDVTASQWIMPAGVWAITQSSGAGRAVATFQTPITSTQYRLVLFNANATSGAVSLKLDRIAVSPVSIPVGAPVTDWQPYTLTIGGSTSAPTPNAGATSNAYWRRVGANVEISYRFQQTSAGTAGSGTYLFPIPSGLTIDTSKITVTTNNSGAGGTNLGVGSFATTTAGNTNLALNARVAAYNSTNLCVIATGASSSAQSYTYGSVWTENLGTAPVYITFQASVPIAGWSSQVQMSSDTDTRVCLAEYTIASGQAVSATTPINFSSQVYDTHAAVTTGATTWKFTAPVTGYYDVAYHGAYSAADGRTIDLYKNGTLQWSILAGYSSSYIAGSSTNIFLNAGDYIDLRPSAAITTTVAPSRVVIKRISGPAVVAASETVACRYSNGAGTVTNTTFATLPFTTKAFDTHNAFNGSTGVFTAPVSGKYAVSSQVLTGGFSGGVVFYLSIFVNGVEYSGHVIQNVAAYSASTTGIVNDQIQLNAGDLVTIRARNSAGAGGINASSLYNWVSIFRVGN